MNKFRIMSVFVVLAMVFSFVNVSPALATFGTIAGAGATWFLRDDVSTTNGLPAGGFCTLSSNGIQASVADAIIPGQGDPFDFAVMYWVDNTRVGGFLSITSPTTASFSPVSIAGLNVQLKYEALTSSQTMRAYLSLTNPTAASISVPMTYVNNFGSDGSTVIKGSSSGDINFTTSDAWLVTDDFSSTGGDPANTTVLYGPGAQVTPSSVSQTVFNCAGTQGTLASYNITVPAGQTRALMMFQQLSSSSTIALANAPMFDSMPIDPSLVAGLTSTEINQVLNWTSNQTPTAVAGGPYLVAVESSVAFDGSGSSDPDIGDTLTESWIADGGTVAGSTYTAGSVPGIYDVCLTVNDGTVDSEPDCTIVVVYDPSAGFVTGGGWIDSQAGAYKDDESLSGKATFGFVSKYKKGANVPTGNTEFHFQAAGFNFHSGTYEWLVVNQGGANAQFKGKGTVNGALDSNGNAYKFMLWAGDDSTDTFRIMIWSELDGVETVVYDNGFDQELGGGSIVIHQK